MVQMLDFGVVELRNSVDPQTAFPKTRGNPSIPKIPSHGTKDVGSVGLRISEVSKVVDHS